jgi:hypothetical protein
MRDEHHHVATGKLYEIKAGTLYALDKHEPHRLLVKRRMRVGPGGRRDT